jgi:CheY-like chemotaxis protein
MGGDLTYESVPGCGTRARLSLMAAEMPVAPVTPAPRLPTEGMRRLRILVVDDDADVRGALARVLGARHDVDAVGSVEAALASIPDGPHDLILCDVMMPDGGGERIWAEVSERCPERATRIVFLTGGAATPESRAFLSRQPRPVLEKPLDLDALRRVTLRLGIA